MYTIAKIITAPLIFILGYAGYSITPQSTIDNFNNQIDSLSVQLNEQQVKLQETKLGAFTTSSAGTYRLSNSISSTATSINLSSFKEPISNIAYTMSYIGSSVVYATLDPQNPTKTETISFTGITQNANGTALLTGVTRGLSKTPGASACTASTTLATSHSGQTALILSNPACFYSEFAAKKNDETITGDWKVPTPANATSIVNRDYVQGLTFGGIGGASETATGTLEIATQIETASSTTNGTLGRLAIPSSISTSTYNPATAPLRVVVTGNSGTIDNRFISTSTIEAPPVGSIIGYWASTTPPTGYIFADGASYATSTYPSLFNQFGYRFGGSGSTFNVPVSVVNNEPFKFEQSKSVSNAGTASLSMPWTVSASSTLIVLAIDNPSGSLGTPTFGSQNFTSANSSNSNTQMWYIVNPFTGTKNITVTGANTSFNMIATSYTGVASTTVVQSAYNLATSLTTNLMWASTTVSTSVATSSLTVSAFFSTDSTAGVPTLTNSYVRRQVILNTVGVRNMIIGDMIPGSTDGLTRGTLLMSTFPSSTINGVMATFSLPTTTPSVYGIIKR